MIMMMKIMMMRYPSPEAEDPSKYCDQFLDRPDHLNDVFDQMSSCEEHIMRRSLKVLSFNMRKWRYL